MIRSADTVSAPRALAFLRVATALVLWAHGLHRALTGGYVPFGGWLDSQGVPLGPLVAAGITLFEVVAPPVWALGWLVRPLCAVHAAVLLGGIAMVHLPSGWFVVGAGRNGMEFSVLLLCCLAASAWAAPGRGEGPSA